ncbi:uncharacterized protein LOC117117679 isoform X2 [Anneissia japonica]|uniref:uncharacterized protein LOC117117679 isoform X2 n=1 Tax=Anneissia japonica TaxID=1529436 RepID=UPI001425B9DE|nr:uncharacterized protein LOC117117679 isoform X2 [Anneissia japonica]
MSKNDPKRYPEAVLLPGIEVKRVAEAKTNVNRSRNTDHLRSDETETPQENLGVSPFELLYGRKVRGPIAILSELMTGENETPETKTTYEYVLDLRNRLEETCESAHAEFTKSSARYKKYYDKKARSRGFELAQQSLSQERRSFRYVFKDVKLILVATISPMCKRVCSRCIRER